MDPDSVVPKVDYQKLSFKDRIPKKILLIILAVILILAPLAFIAFTLTQKSKVPMNFIPTAVITPNPAPSSGPGPKILTLRDCNPSPVIDPLVVKVYPGDPILIQLQGNVNDVKLNSDKSAYVDLLSTRADERYFFTVQNTPGSVYDGITSKDILPTDLKRGQFIDVEYNCFPQKQGAERLILARVSILLKR